MLRTVFGSLLLLLAVGWTFGQSGQLVRPSVSVVGEAELSVSPDQVVFTLEVITAAKDVTAAKRANDTSVAKTLEAARALRVEAQDIQTDSLTISPKYTAAKDPRGEHVLIAYEVTKRILITLKDLSKIDTLLSSVVEAGVNRVVGISIENSQIKTYQEKVRVMAVENARSKAQSYAGKLGQTLGKAYMIREEGADAPTSMDGSGTGNGVDGGTDDPGTPAAKIDPFSRQVTFSLGQIKIEETIYVTFELR